MTIELRYINKRCKNWIEAIVTDGGSLENLKNLGKYVSPRIDSWWKTKLILSGRFARTKMLVLKQLFVELLVYVTIHVATDTILGLLVMSTLC